MEIREKVDRYAELDARLAGIKNEMENLKADFEEYAEKDLQDTKLKTVEIYGNNGAKVIVQNAATVKPISWVVIKEVLGKTVPDFIKEETKFSLTDVAKTMLANMFKGDYIEDTLSNVVAHMTPDQKKQALLMKRLKGKYKQDQKNILKYTDLSEKEASDNAFLVQDVMAYQNILRIIEASGFDGTVEEAVAKIKSSLIVEDSIKVTLEAE